MADRYWVGGTGTWNTTSTTNWSASSGGGSGASVPTVADSVFFDQAGTYTVTMTGALACLDITVSAGTVTFATGTSPTLDVRGSMSLLAGTLWSSTGTITFSSTTTGRTVTTNGTSIAGQVVFNGTGGAWTLGSAITVTNVFGISVLAGTFDTSSANSYSVVAGGLAMSGTLNRTINLNASTFTITGNSSTVILATSTTNLTFNSGTSQFNLTGTSAGISVGGQIFYNVAWTNSSTATSRPIVGINTFNNFSVTAPSLAGIAFVTFAAQQTINGTLSTTGTAGNRRVFFASATYGISVDLVVNSTPSLTDADFRGLYVRGTSAPISGTRIGNRGECRNITFSTPKTVYWNLAGAQNWSANGWAATSTGSPSTDNFPLPQDTATFTNAGSVTGTITLDTAIAYVPNVDMSGRTSAITIAFGATTVYGNWTNGSGTAFVGSAALTFSGGTTQTITSSGKTFSGITIDTYGGTVQLADALNIGSNTLTVTNGTFTTAGYAVTGGTFSSSNGNVRTINLGASTLNFSNNNAFTFTNSTNLTFNAGTSQLNHNFGTIGGSFAGGGLTFYNLSFTNTGSQTHSITGANTFNNLAFTAPASAGLMGCTFPADQTINGTLTCAGASAVRRIFLRSDTIGTQRTITAAAISADDCDFRDINLAGAASGASPTRAGDCGGNTGITFPAAKTVYWNLAGAQNWSATAWAPGSGGTPDINNFPLAQDTAVFDEAAGSVTGTITINAAWNIGTFDASLRTSAMTLTTSTNTPVVYGDWKFGTGVTSSSTTGTITFSSGTTETITSNGVQFGCPVTINHPSGTVQLADALSLGATRTLTLTTGTFDAVTYNVTTGQFNNSSTSAATLKMGSGTWTLSGTNIVWNCSIAPTLIAGTSTIVLSDTSTAAREFRGGGLYYNKLTIGGTTGISTLTITGANTFGELASTKTVAHTITFPLATHTIGKWAVTGTVGNVVTVNSSTAASAFTLSIAGPANSGIDYLSIRDCTVASDSPGEFYVGANSTNVSGNTRVIFTAAPAPRTLYWVGGTGNWSDTSRWSTSSGGGSGAAIPTSLDAVIFDSLSNATAYTATIDAGVTLARCASFTMAGPAAGNVTFAGSVGIAFHGNVSFAATGITRTYTGAMQWAGNSSYTFTTNGLTLASSCTVIGIGATWTLSSAINIGNSTFTVTCGTFSTSASNYSLTASAFSSNNSSVRSISLNGSTVTLSTISLSSFLATVVTNLTFNAGTSQLNLSGSDAGIACGGLTFNNVSFTSGAVGGRSITGTNTFNTLSFAGNVQVGVIAATFGANQTITTLTLNAGTAAAFRTFLASNTIGTTRTLTVGTLTAGAADIDFRDITISGAAAPISGTRFGDAKGNSGITFDAAKTVYYRQTGSANWGATGTGSWSATSGGGFDATQFPLAQDTAIFPAATYPASGSTTTINANYNIGTIDMSLRTSNTMTLATGSTTPQIYGNWINGTGTTLSGTGVMTFAGRGSQTITSAGRTFTQRFNFNTPGGSVTLQDAASFGSNLSGANTITAGTFDANGYNVTTVTTINGNCGITTSGDLAKTLAIGSGTWSIGCTGSAWNNSGTNVTVTGTGTITLTNSNTKTFVGGSISYSGITLDQGGAGTLTITGNNTFKTITNTYSATGATSIVLGNTTQTLTNPWTATGAATRVLTVSGTSAASPGTLIFSGAGTAANVDYLTVSNVRAYPLVDDWYAGANSTNSGSLGWYFVAAGGTVYSVTITETGTGTDSITATVTLLGTISETGTGTDSISAGLQYLGSIAETGTGTDSISGIFRPSATITETSTGTDLAAAILAAFVNISETATGTDSVDAPGSTYNPSLSETATGTDTFVARAAFYSAVAESANASDLITSLKGFFCIVLESASISDLASSSPVYVGQIIELVSGTDADSAQYNTRPIVSESATATDTNTAGFSVNSSLSESATGTDAVLTRYIALPVVQESGSATDTTSAKQIFKVQIAESVTGQDVISAFAQFAAAITESGTGTDVVSALRILTAIVSEAATGTELVSALQVFNSLIAEGATVTDALQAAGSTYNTLIAETASQTDRVVAQATFPASLAETATGTETVVARFIPLANVTESATITDAASALAAFAARVAESATITDAVSPPGSIYNPVVLAVAQLVDQVSPAGSIYNAPVLVSATITDSLIGGFLWNLIDDSQNPDWNTISTPQNPSWATIDSSQGTGWVTIPTPQNPGWSNIDDSQSPNWQNINTLN
jgi:hypothetical protein